MNNKIRWCLRQKNGVKLIKLKPHLSRSYMNEAHDSLNGCPKLDGKWKLISGYYACYNAFYSLLMATGIKCEIHDCSIELMELFGFSKADKDFMKKLKQNRVQAQYYLKDVLLDNERKVIGFVSKCKEINEELNSEKIEKIRSEMKR